MPYDAEELKESLKQLMTEPDPDWTFSARRLGARVVWLVRSSGFSAFPEVLDILTSGTPAAKFRAAYVLGYTVRNEYGLLDSLPTLSDSAQGWVDLATRGGGAASRMTQRRRAGIQIVESDISEEAVVGFIDSLGTSAAPWAAEGLLTLGGQSSISAALTGGLENPVLEIRGCCAVILSHLGKTESSPDQDGDADAIPRRSSNQIERAQEAVLRVLLDVLLDARASNWLRSNALRGIPHAVRAVPSELAASVATLRAALGGTSRQSARHAAVALANLVPTDAQDAVPVLVEALTQNADSYEDFSVQVAEALVRIDRRFGLHPRVLEILENQDPSEGYA